MSSLSIVLPTYQESGNIVELMTRLETVLSGIDYEIVVVDDDSPDGTWKIAADHAAYHPKVKVIRRITDKGLSSAILAGFNVAKGDVLGVMDADMSHDENILPAMFREILNGHDLVVGSRRIRGGGAERWPWYRRLTSEVATRLARWAIPLRLSDPMSGFFLIKRNVYEKTKEMLRPRGYKILLEIVARAPGLRLKEVPFIFKDRRSGYSKLSTFVILSYLETLADLHFGIAPMDKFRETYHRGRYKIVKGFLREGNLLDLGCGKPCDSMPDGAFLREVGRGVGLDMKVCQGPFEFKQGDLLNLPFPDGHFDNVTAMEVLEHVDDLPKALSEINRVLKPGGNFVMSVPDDNAAWDMIWTVWTKLIGRMWEDTHHVHLTRAGWRKVIDERFEVLHATRHWHFDLVFHCRKKA